MSWEIFKNRTPLAQADAFIELAYTVDRKLVDKTIRNAESDKDPHVSAVDYLISHLSFEVERAGIENVPVMIAAVDRLEKNLPENERKLTQGRRLYFLYKAEMQSAISNSDPSFEFKDVTGHLQRAKILWGFLVDITNNSIEHE
jgi:hypothetical protein